MPRLWENATGWEYDVLRLLPPEEARGVWSRAWTNTGRRMLVTWWAYPLLAVFGLTFTIFNILFIWNVAGALGWGLGGRIAAEVLFHLLVFWLLKTVFKHLRPSVLRPFIREELFLLIRQELAPEHPLRRLKQPGVSSEAHEHAPTASEPP